MNGSGGGLCVSPPTYAGERETQWVLVVVVGTGMSLVSILQNSLLLCVILRKREFRLSYLFYMIFLALCDILTAVSYIAVMTLEVVYIQYQSERLSQLWHGYLRPLFTLSHVTIAISTYLVIVATLERFLLSLPHHSFHISQTKRLAAVSTAIAFGLLFKGTVYFEIAIATDENCTNHMHYRVTASSLAHIPLFRSIWMFWVRNFVTILLPFGILLYFNAVIVLSMVRKGRRFSETIEGNQNRMEVRTATRMMILVVSVYLIVNVLRVVITVWEQIDRDLMLHHPHFYLLTSDLISLLIVLGGAFRLQVFACCNKAIFQGTQALLKDIFTCACCVSDTRKEKHFNRLAYHHALIDSPLIDLSHKATNNGLPLSANHYNKGTLTSHMTQKSAFSEKNEVEHLLHNCNKSAVEYALAEFNCESQL